MLFIKNSYNPDIIDINYGCPVPKITKKGAGSAAMKDLCRMEEITSAVDRVIIDEMCIVLFVVALLSISN